MSLPLIVTPEAEDDLADARMQPPEGATECSQG